MRRRGAVKVVSFGAAEFGSRRTGQDPNALLGRDGATFDGRTKL